MSDSDAPCPDSVEGSTKNADQVSCPRDSNDGGDRARTRLFWLVVGDDSEAVSQEDQSEDEPHRLIARLRRLRADYLEAHRSGMAALDGHNFKGLRAAIEQEHDILKEQDHVINALRRPYPVKPEPQLAEASERA